jgi:hypothetical protein
MLAACPLPRNPLVALFPANAYTLAGEPVLASASNLSSNSKPAVRRGLDPLREKT